MTLAVDDSLPGALQDLDFKQLFSQVTSITMFGAGVACVTGVLLDDKGFWDIILAGLLPLGWNTLSATWLTYWSARVEDERRSVQRRMEFESLLSIFAQMLPQTAGAASAEDAMARLKDSNTIPKIRTNRQRDEDAAAQTALQALQGMNRWENLLLPGIAGVIGLVELGVARLLVA